MNYNDIQRKRLLEILPMLHRKDEVLLKLIADCNELEKKYIEKPVVEQVVYSKDEKTLDLMKTALFWEVNILKHLDKEQLDILVQELISLCEK